MKIVAVIPVRYDSKRFPGKPLALFKGKTMLENVYRRVCQSNILGSVIVATDSTLIKKTAESFGAKVIVTPENCCSGSDRVAKAIADLEADIIVNVQGDQPLLPQQIIEEIVSPLREQPDLVVTTAITILTDEVRLQDPNVVKVVVDQDKFALYFSRYPIPYQQKQQSQMDFYKHIGVYAYRREFLLKYAEWQPGVLERSESLEQLRILENGCRIKTIITAHDSPSVDTAADLELLEANCYEKKE